VVLEQVGDDLFVVVFGFVVFLLFFWAFWRVLEGFWRLERAVEGQRVVGGAAEGGADAGWLLVGRGKGAAAALCARAAAARH